MLPTTNEQTMAQVCAVIVVAALFVLLSISNGGLNFGGVPDEDDLQLYEEWKANKARVDAQALSAEEERRKGRVRPIPQLAHRPPPARSLVFGAAAAVATVRFAFSMIANACAPAACCQQARVRGL